MIWYQDDSIARATNHGAQKQLLVFAQVIGVSDQDVATMFVRDVLNGASDRVVERVRYICDQYGNHVGTLSAQAAGCQVRVVAKLLYRLHHPLVSILTDRYDGRGITQDARHGTLGNPGQLSDITHGDWRCLYTSI